MTSSKGNIFRVTGTLCGEFTGHRWIQRTKVSDASFDIFFNLRPNKRHYELPMEKKVPWNGAVSMRSRAGSWETLSICITLRHNQGAPADMHAGILIICRFPLA